jgi:hypothetical protein
MAQKKSTAAPKKAAAKKTTARKAPAKKTAAKRTSSSKKFIRNTNYSPFRIRLERHDQGKKPIHLAPRGTRGDLAPILKEDLSDPDLQANLALGVIEIITEAEAIEVAKKQTVNQQAVHPALAALKNEKGEEYGDNALVLEKSDEERGVVVAELTDGNITVDGRSGIQRRKPGEAPGTPQTVVGAELNHLPEGREAEYLSDVNARRKDLQGPEAGLGGIQRIVVNEPQKG